MNDFDFAVIGAGPGGLDAALRASELGLKTVLIEKNHPGGTCLNTGCIPTKTLLASSRLYERLKQAPSYGLQVSSPSFNWSSLIQQKAEIVDRIRKATMTQIQKSNFTWLQGNAKLAGPNKITVTGKDSQIITAKAILIATGSSTSGLPNLAINGKNIISSDEALNLPAPPKSILVVGGGAVGVEFASFFHALGTQVTVVEMMNRLLPQEDEDCAKRLENLFSRKGIKVLTSVTVQNTAEHAGMVQVQLSSRDVLESEIILLGVGRKRNTQDLDLQTAGIALEKNGAIPVSPYCETKTPGIFAIGDVIVSPALAHVASAEGALVAENLCGSKKRSLNYEAVPSCVYSDPEVASVGLGLVKMHKAQNTCLEVKIPFTAIAKAQAERETDGFFKLFADSRKGIVLGAAAIGAHVTELMPEIALAVRLGLTVRDLAETVHAHPTAAEIIFLSARELSRKL